MENNLKWFNGDTVCRGTHPKMPNYEGHSRGRALGIEVDKSKLHDAEYDVNLLIQIYKKVK